MTAALLLAGASAAMAQSAAGFAADPNAETNQVPAPSNAQPADPGAGSYSSARTPTDPQKRSDADNPGRIPTETAPPVVGETLATEPPPQE
jgi:hypothetical protein